MTSLPRLPISVRLYPGETVASYWARLCMANTISQKDLWLSLRHHDRSLPIRVTPRSALWHIEALGGLADGALVRDAGGTLCEHGGATRRVECPSCRMMPAAVTLCLRCAGGDHVTATRMHGPVCVRHRRWHANGRDVSLSGSRKHFLAQRLLNGSLTLRGVPYQSPEVDAAAELLKLGSVKDEFEVDTPDLEIQRFPERIALTAILTDARLATVLMARSLGGHTLAMLFARVVDAHADGRGAAERIVGELRIEGREVWIAGVAVPVRGSCVLTPAAKRILPRAKTLRAHLLHHRVHVGSR